MHSIYIQHRGRIHYTVDNSWAYAFALYNFHKLDAKSEHARCHRSTLICTILQTIQILRNVGIQIRTMYDNGLKLAAQTGCSLHNGLRKRPKNYLITWVSHHSHQSCCLRFEVILNGIIVNLEPSKCGPRNAIN